MVVQFGGIASLQDWPPGRGIIWPIWNDLYVMHVDRDLLIANHASQPLIDKLTVSFVWMQLSPVPTDTITSDTVTDYTCHRVKLLLYH